MLVLTQKGAEFAEVETESQAEAKEKWPLESGRYQEREEQAR